MKIVLRPHHFLCLKGYKGMNYNKAQIENWNRIHQILTENPKTEILILGEKDDLCKKCPCTDIINKSSICLEMSVQVLDNKIKNILNLVNGQVYKYKDIVDKLNKIMTPQKHKELCSMCAWWKKGLCQDSFLK